MEVYVCEKPSVGVTFAKVLGCRNKKNGYYEGNGRAVTWAVGHLVKLSYPEVYDPKYKKWNLNDIPFLPDVYKYELIENVKNQFAIVRELLYKADVIYDCGDSG